MTGQCVPWTEHRLGSEPGWRDLAEREVALTRIMDVTRHWAVRTVSTVTSCMRHANRFKAHPGVSFV